METSKYSNEFQWKESFFFKKNFGLKKKVLTNQSEEWVQAEQVFVPLQQIMVIVQVVWISQSIVLHPTVSQAGSCPNTTFQPPPGTYYYIIHTQSDIPITSGEKTHILWKRGHAEKFG